MKCASVSAVLVLTILAAGPAAAVDIHDTLMLADPTVSDDHVAFIYAEDLWVADRSGGTARRLTTHEGTESNPNFSPDGEWIAFTGHYDGNDDVYLIPVDGGSPTRLTWHPGADIVRGLHPGRVGDSLCFGAGVPHQSLRPVLYRAGGRRLARPGCPCLRLSRGAIHPMVGSSPTTRSGKLSGSGRTIAAARPRGSGSMTRVTTRWCRFRNPRVAPTTSTPPGSATPSISSPTATASSTSSPSIAVRARSSS